MRDAPEIYAESPFEGKVEILKSMARCVTYHEGRAVIEWLKPYSFLIIPGFLEEKNAVRENPFMLPSRDILRTTLLEFAEWIVGDLSIS